MNWSLFLLFCIALTSLALFKNYDGFKGGRWRGGSGGHHGPFTIVDAVVIVLLLFWFFYSS